MDGRQRTARRESAGKVEKSRLKERLFLWSGAMVRGQRADLIKFYLNVFAVEFGED